VNDKKLMKIFIYSAVSAALFLSGCAADTPTANNSAASSNGNSNARTNSAPAAATCGQRLEDVEKSEQFRGNLREAEISRREKRSVKDHR
jgi:hypothetical protein